MTEQRITSKEEADKVASEYFKTTEQPDKNLMIFEQVEGCCEMIAKLLEQIIPNTTHVGDCIITLKAWQDNNLKHLKGAFE